jgi:hypothetical protein
MDEGSLSSWVDELSKVLGNGGNAFATGGSPLDAGGAGWADMMLPQGSFQSIVEYRLFLDPSKVEDQAPIVGGQGREVGVNGGGQTDNVDRCIDNLERRQRADEIVRFADELCHSYTWHREAFKLQDKRCRDGTMSYLYGKQNIGDNIEDEWFIVFVLLRITENFPWTTASITDEDGEFMLIEAAHVIPRYCIVERVIPREWCLVRALILTVCMSVYIDGWILRTALIEYFFDEGSFTLFVMNILILSTDVIEREEAIHRGIGGIQRHR